MSKNSNLEANQTLLKIESEIVAATLNKSDQEVFENLIKLIPKGKEAKELPILLAGVQAAIENNLPFSDVKNLINASAESLRGTLKGFFENPPKQNAAHQDKKLKRATSLSSFANLPSPSPSPSFLVELEEILSSKSANGGKNPQPSSPRFY